uniref:Sorting nexin 20 n=1 Tax=Strix occidentalis caurina TaxID=311401 RepID=A0A8D0FT96_STROC
MIDCSSHGCYKQSTATEILCKWFYMLQSVASSPFPAPCRMGSVTSGDKSTKQQESVIERRYSDFEKLHRNLLEEFSEEMEDVTFPKKTLTGNFTEEIINERKLAFKDYLRLLYSMKYIRRSKKFIDFLTRPELQEAYGCLRGGQYTKALEILLEVIGLQERLTRGNPLSIVPTLCMREYTLFPFCS